MSNSIQTLLAMLGGGAGGYAQDKARRFDEADVDRKYAEGVREFGESAKQRSNEFNQSIGLDRDKFQHGSDFDWAGLFQQSSEGAKDRAARSADTRFIYSPTGGNRGSGTGSNPGPAQQDAQGRALMAAYLGTDPGFTAAFNRMKGTLDPRKPMFTDGQIAYQVRQALQMPPERMDPRFDRGTGSSTVFGNPDVKPPMAGGTAPTTTPAANIPPAPPGVDQKEWEQYLRETGKIP